jgi:GTP-binding protein
MVPVVVIAGRPNVGKSTLFNRLVGRRAALVADTPGVTRDRKEAEAMLRGRRVRLVDTAGLEEAAAESLPGRMQALSNGCAGTIGRCCW